MTKQKNLYRYITTKGHLEWDGEKYVAVSDEGYWYAGDVALAGGDPTIDTDSWNFYDDNGTEATATVFNSAANNTDPTLLTDVVYHVRWAVSETGSGTWTDQILQLEYNHENNGWLDVNATSSVIQSAASVLVEANNCTDRLTGQGTWQESETQDETDGLTAGVDRVGGEYINAVWSFQILSAGVADGETIDLRITDELLAWTNENQALPTITVSKPEPPEANDNAIMFSTNF